jgi:hypothetical protein
MPDQTPTAYTIVPWVRRGLASLISGPPTTNYATMPVTLRVNGASVSGPAIRLIGPGQITALDARAVVRTDPRNGATAFEPNYLAMVELAQPDLPWMFSPAPQVNGRVQPWICLVVLPDTDGVVLEPAAGGISILRIQAPLDPKTELPDLSTIDAWAHAQVTGANVTGGDLTNALDGDPATTVSRLVAARKLEANKSYIACIVPTYRAGVNGALGLPVDDHDLAPAWDTTVVAPFLLPAYYVFRFHTGEGGDFASLAQKLRPPKQKLNAGTRSMDVGQPGFGAAGVAGTVLGLEGALKAVDSQSTPWPAGAQATYESEFRAALAPPAAADPVIAPPTYGSAQSGSALPATGAAPVWLGELNLDPRSRAAASAGAQIVQRDQQALAASAWDQLGEIRKANQLLRQAQLARQVSASLNQRHLERVAGDGKWLQITSPLHSRVQVALAGVIATMHGQIQASRLPSGSLSPAMRKIARPGGTIGRQLPAGVPQIVDRLNTPVGSATTALLVAGPVQPPKGMIGLDDVSPDFQVKNMTAASVTSATGWKLAAAVISKTGTFSPGVALDAPTTTGPAAPPETSPAPGRTAGPIVNPPLIDWTTNPNIPDILKVKVPNLPSPIVFPSDSDALETVKADFKTAAQSINTYLNTAPASPPDPPPLGGQASLAPVRAQLQAHLNPADTIRARLGARMPLNTGADPLQPVEVGPKYPQPMYAPLAQLSPDWMLPGISAVEADCATLLATNTKFIEAYMVGLNEELSGELLWREFPADRRVTFFQNFWGAATPDIGPIAAFNATGVLGTHVASPSGTTRFVLLIRATLFQRYPNAMVYAAPAKWVNGVRTLTDDVQYPVFRGNIGADVNFFGFDIDNPRGSADPNAGKPGWYFVIAEHVTEPRLGLEPENSATPVSWNDLSWQDVAVKGNYIDVSTAPPKPAAEPVAWSENSAALGYILIRRPVRVAMHALALLGEQA